MNFERPYRYNSSSCLLPFVPQPTACPSNTVTLQETLSEAAPCLCPPKPSHSSDAFSLALPPSDKKGNTSRAGPVRRRVVTHSRMDTTPLLPRYTIDGIPTSPPPSPRLSASKSFSEWRGKTATCICVGTGGSTWYVDLSGETSPEEFKALPTHMTYCWPHRVDRRITPSSVSADFN